jgi:hypothetical protein
MAGRTSIQPISEESDGRKRVYGGAPDGSGDPWRRKIEYIEISYYSRYISYLCSEVLIPKGN